MEAAELLPVDALEDGLAGGVGGGGGGGLGLDGLGEAAELHRSDLHRHWARRKGWGGESGRGERATEWRE